MKMHKRLLLGLVGLLCTLAMVFSVQRVGGALPAIGTVSNLPVIILDPGHGGQDGGAVGVDKIVEKDINLSIALMLRDQLEISGFTVVMTREDDRSIHDEGIKGAKKQKTSDLHNRLSIMNSYPNALFLSIHQNQFGDSRSNGIQIFYSPNNEESKELASTIQQNMVEMLQPENKRLQKSAGKNLFLMYEAQCPAVLIECGFLSNRTEAYKLADPEYQSKLAFVTLCSVLEYLQVEIPPDMETQQYNTMTEITQ
ncbi:N-acetylmuramoyl-L-alanine amidase [Oscillospiraceae bacterium MB08-C2-2]|nr:N-acetylmuramoyl-L-alanine amidase [Oscillospiraceae bacterium MB08-C2-2]